MGYIRPLEIIFWPKKQLKSSAYYWGLHEEICMNILGIVSTLIVLKVAKATYNINFSNHSIKNLNFLFIRKRKDPFKNTLVTFKSILYFQCIKPIYILLSDNMGLPHILTLKFLQQMAQL